MSDIPNEGAIMWAELFKQRDELTRAQQALAQQVERLNDRVTQLATYCATVEKERDEARAEASFDALAKGARDVPCSGPCSESARCGACLAHANQAGLGRMLERTQNQRDAWAARFASLRAQVDRLQLYGLVGHGPILVSRADVVALFDAEKKEPA